MTTDSNLQVAAGFGTLIITGLLVLPIGVLGRHLQDNEAPKLDDMTAIEASIAYRKTAQPKQPQKQMRAPDPVVPPEGVSHDDQKKPDPPKPDPPKPDKPPDPKQPASIDDIKKFHHDDDDPVGKPVQAVGDFNGSERGFGDETKGDPYFGQLSADLHNAWEYPQILNASGTPVGCVHLTQDGKIADIKLWDASDNQSFNDSVTIALKKVQKARQDDPNVKPVPSYLLTKITKWICFRFNPPAP